MRATPKRSEHKSALVFFTHLVQKNFPKLIFIVTRDNIVGLICPHAGYMYSGPVAAHAFYELAQDGKPDTVVLLGPNHTGYGSALALMREGVWRTPLGDVEIDTCIS